MVKRHLSPSRERSFFLFGARGTGKTTFLRQWVSSGNVMWLDLLDPVEEDRYARRPQRLAERLAATRNPVDWVVIDEVQKVSRLLDVVHGAIESSAPASH